MAQSQEVLDFGRALRDQIFTLSQDGNFSTAESDGFTRLHAYYHIALQRFFLAPAYGNASTKYDGPVNLAKAAKTLGIACQPGNQLASQAFYNAVFSAGVGLKAITGTISKPLKIAPS